MSTRARIQIAIALGALGLAWPILDILGRNAEFFIARGSTREEIVQVLVMLAALVPILASLPASLPGRLGRGLGLVWLGVLSIALSYLVVRQLAVPSAGFAALALGVGLLVAIDRFEPVQAVFRLLAWSPVALGAYFLFATPSGALVLDRGVPVSGTVAPQATPPVVMLVFDELPLASLIDPAGNLRADRYPNFAQLAADGIWYRNAMTTQQQTEHSVPAIVTGVNPERTLNPFAGQYPGSLFTALSRVYGMQVAETMTQMCPVTVCPLTTDRGGPLLDDLSVVAGHVLAPPDLSESLPPIDRNWGNFGAATEDFNAIESFNDARRNGDPRRTLEEVATAIRAADPARPAFFFAHALLPHNPWQYLPTGQRYPIDDERLPGSEKTGWGDNAWLSAQALQRHLLQVQYVDRALGDILEALADNGMYEQALVIVVSDHGIALRPNIEHWRRIEADTVGAVASVPLIVKLPRGEQAGTIDDRRALTVDIVPTVAEVLEFGLPWEIDGASLLGPDPKRSETTTTGPDSQATYGVDGKEKLAVAAANAIWFPTGDPYELLPEDAPNLLGEPASSLGSVRDDVIVRLDRPNWYTNVDPSSDVLPTRVTGTVRGLAASEDALLAVLVNDRIAAIVRSFHDRGRSGFQAMIPPETLGSGRNSVEVVAFEA